MSVIHVIGIGDDGLDGLGAPARRLIEEAETLIGGGRHLAMVKNSPAERLPWRTPLRDTIADVRERLGRRVVVLATGDPMDYGIGVTLVREFGIEAVRVHPVAGAVAFATARMGWPRSRVEVLTLHGRPLSHLARAARPGAHLIAFAHDGSTATEAAFRLVEMGLGASTITALEHLGSDAENRIDTLASEWGDRRTEDLVTLAILCRADAGAQPVIGRTGLPDDAYEHDGKLTKRAVRAATMALLAPSPHALLWDVGAGSGSIAIEWLRSEPTARAVAIENRSDRIAAIRTNADVLGAPDLRIVEGQAPGALAELDTPDAIFIGGGLSEQGLVDHCWSRLGPGGRLVANAVTLEGEAVLADAHRRLGGELARIEWAEAVPVGAFRGWRPRMPVTQWAVRKPW